LFNTLLESKPVKQRSPAGTAGSVVAHVVLISLAVYATAHAAIRNEKEKVEKIEFTEMKKEAPPPPKPPPPPPPTVTVAPPPPKGFQVLTAPVNIPDVIPQVDLTKKVTDEADFSGKGVAGGTGKGVVGGTGPVGDQPYFDFQVEKQAGEVPGTPSPKYPEVLRSAGVDGQVLAQFVIDTTGRAEASTFKVIQSTNDAFTSSVKEALPKMRFYPAEVGGHKVKELVQLPFAFNITK
jgi:periplasmic protein TonB